jgi:hypothetical protein
MVDLFDIAALFLLVGGSLVSSYVTVRFIDALFRPEKKE